MKTDNYREIASIISQNIISNVEQDENTSSIIEIHLISTYFGTFLDLNLQMIYLVSTLSLI